MTQLSQALTKLTESFAFLQTSSRLPVVDSELLANNPEVSVNANGNPLVNYNEPPTTTAEPEQATAGSPVVDKSELPESESESIVGDVGELLVDISKPLKAEVSKPLVAESEPLKASSNPVATQDEPTGTDVGSLLVNLSEPLEREVSRPLVAESEPPGEQVGVNEGAIAATTPAAVETPLAQGSSFFREGTAPASTEPPEPPAPVETQAHQDAAPIAAFKVIGTEALTGAKLAERLGVNPSSVTRNRDEGSTHFRHWSGRHDPEGIAWQHRSGTARTPQYHPFACLIPRRRTK